MKNPPLFNDESQKKKLLNKYKNKEKKERKKNKNITRWHCFIEVRFVGALDLSNRSYLQSSRTVRFGFQRFSPPLHPPRSRGIFSRLLAAIVVTRIGPGQLLCVQMVVCTRAHRSSIRTSYSGGRSGGTDSSDGRKPGIELPFRFKARAGTLSRSRGGGTVVGD